MHVVKNWFEGTNWPSQRRFRLENFPSLKTLSKALTRTNITRSHIPIANFSSFIMHQVDCKRLGYSFADSPNQINIRALNCVFKPFSLNLPSIKMSRMLFKVVLFPVLDTEMIYNRSAYPSESLSRYYILYEDYVMYRTLFS